MNWTGKEEAPALLEGQQTEGGAKFADAARRIMDPQAVNCANSISYIRDEQAEGRKGEDWSVAKRYIRSALQGLA